MAKSVHEFTMTNKVSGRIKTIQTHGYQVADLKRALRFYYGLEPEQQICILDEDIPLEDDAALEGISTNLSFALLSMQNLLKEDLDDILQDVPAGRVNPERIINGYDEALQRINTYNKNGFTSLPSDSGPRLYNKMSQMIRFIDEGESLRSDLRELQLYLKLCMLRPNARASEVVVSILSTTGTIYMLCGFLKLGVAMFALWCIQTWCLPLYPCGYTRREFETIVHEFFEKRRRREERV